MGDIQKWKSLDELPQFLIFLKSDLTKVSGENKIGHDEMAVIAKYYIRLASA